MFLSSLNHSCESQSGSSSPNMPLPYPPLPLEGWGCPYKYLLKVKEVYKQKKMASLITIILIISSIFMSSSNSMSVDYYKQTCPEAEPVISKIVHKGMINDKTVPAALLRMHFHDCFIRV